MFRKTQRNGRQYAALRAAVAETLESRRLLAGIEAGVLVARGTGGNDTISLRRTGGDDVIVTTNGVNQTFDMDNFTGVRLEGLGGNDTFNLIDPLTSPVVRNVTVLGGAGSDTVDYSARTAALDFRGYREPDAATASPFAVVTSGAQVDRADNTVERFIGGSAGDRFAFDGFVFEDGEPDLTLEGRGGNDFFSHVADLRATILGGDGDDTVEFDDERSRQTAVFGGAGNDTFAVDNFGFPDLLDAGPGLDRMVAASSHRPVIDISGFAGLENIEGIASGGEVMVIGNALNNTITIANNEESGGATTLRGMGGNDTLVGGLGDERLEGGEGADSLVGNGGDDTLDGGAGTDFGDGGPGADTLISIENTPGGGTDPTTPAIGIDSGVLVARGTGGNDAFSVRRRGIDNVIVTVNALSREFDMDDFTGVRLEGFGGDDRITVVDSLNAPVARRVTIDGGAGNDTLTGNDEDDWILGGDGDDTLVPGAGDDSISGGGGTDTVDYSGHVAGLHFGLTSFMRPEGPTVTRTGETDTLATFLSAEDDRILDTERFIGTAFNDSFRYQASENDESSGFPTITMEGRGGNDTFSNGGIFDRFVAIGGNGDDRFNINAGTNGSAAETTLIGGDGNDTFNFGSDTGPDSIDGGGGIDLISLSFFTQSVVDLNAFTSVENATSARDNVLLIGTPGSNRLEITRGGTIRGGDGNDTLVGSDDPDSLLGEAGNDSLVGNDGDDTLDGGDGTDTLIGGPGNDTLLNGEVTDDDDGGGDPDPTTPSASIVDSVLFVSGTGGNDRITIERTGGDDVTVKVGSLTRQFDMDAFEGVMIRSYGGADSIEMLDALTSPVVRKVTIESGAGDDSVLGSDGEEVIRGGDGNDTLFGFGADDAVFGEAGNDRLFGGLGEDFLDGGDDADFVDGGDGAPNDTVRGGNGTDSGEADAGDDVSSIETLT